MVSTESVQNSVIRVASVFIAIAIADTGVLFAVDSISAVFGVTDEACIVFAANAFAVPAITTVASLVKARRAAP
jgi:tellurite resistance protein TerC